MHWKSKALLQNLIALLPSKLANIAYYQLQRRFGALRSIDPTSRVHAAVKICEKILTHGGKLEGRTVLEVGTGRVPIVPLCCWLMGAREVITIDLNPYLRSELTIEALRFIAANQHEFETVFGDKLNKSRWVKLMEFAESPKFSLKRLLDEAGIRYVAPGDASVTGLKNKSVDFHISYTVLEHVPEETIKNILVEGVRILSDSGLFIHCVDYTDHFAHSDRSISKLNFLRYSDFAWNFYAGNRFMFMNRLRHDDMMGLFIALGIKVIEEDNFANKDVKKLLVSDMIPLSSKFSNKEYNVLKITNSFIVARK